MQRILRTTSNPSLWALMGAPMLEAEGLLLSHLPAQESDRGLEFPTILESEMEKSINGEAATPAMQGCSNSEATKRSDPSDDGDFNSPDKCCDDEAYQGSNGDGGQVTRRPRQRLKLSSGPPLCSLSLLQLEQKILP
ncbi:uncharacterized protein PADG_11876 [Paracoccidioides brasiliensis Pb18]|uniref:Uncharacterized protein n=1 Tax=Paracoccidioides brasiliensis (strain Pb18) TaxID=502780 RepID=A0A0A0HXE2_PARBD|nr:uncharacterized protein PADG_11876 [Paracoccidioides brasiliensis Pb18]KGM92080.1 hypothetical protein PADG_11876 [Paracoccidioides brasiliensis Pb18]